MLLQIKDIYPKELKSILKKCLHSHGIVLFSHSFKLLEVLIYFYREMEVLNRITKYPFKEGRIMLII